MNYMKQIAKMLGVALDEEFEVCVGGASIYMKAKLTDKGFNVIDTNMVGYQCSPSSQIFEWILSGIATIKRKPWKPKDGEPFWHVGICGEPVLGTFQDSTYETNYYKLGNCYRTHAEAEANRDKWLSFYASDEVLEV